MSEEKDENGGEEDEDADEPKPRLVREGYGSPDVWSADEMFYECPYCGSEEIEREGKGEYTGGGYGDRWDEWYCTKCGQVWETERDSGLY